MIKKLGNILSDLRRETGVAQKEISQGIMSISELCRVELGEQELDYILLESLFERLGKSLDKFELVISEEEFQALLLREKIEDMLRQKNWKEAAELLEQYKRSVDLKRPLQKQYTAMIKATINYFISENIVKYQIELEQAFELTFGKWDVTLSPQSVYLCVQEIRILLMYAYIFYRSSSNEQALELAEWIEKYIEMHFIDEEEKVKIFPHCEIVLARIYFRLGRIEDSYCSCVKGRECLVNNGSLTFMLDFLQIQEKCLNIMGDREKQLEYKRSMESLEFLYKISGFEREEDFFLKLLRESKQRECMISNEMIKEMRAAKGYTLEELSENICAYETLLRIEKGQRTPNRKKFYQMMERLGIERKKYYGFIVADDFKLYENVRFYNRMVSQKQREEAAQLLEEIAEKLDTDIPLNKQFVEGERIRQKTWKHEITNEQAIQELTELLQLTMPPLEKESLVYRVPFREEFNLLNQIALLRKNNGEKLVALTIYREIKERYDSGKVPMTFHAVPGFVLYINYLGALEVNDNLKEAEAVGMEGIKHSLRCERGDGVGQILANMSCIYEKREEWEKEKMFLRFSYYILKLYEREHDKTLIKNVYMKKYEEELN